MDSRLAWLSSELTGSLSGESAEKPVVLRGKLPADRAAQLARPAQLAQWKCAQNFHAAAATAANLNKWRLLGMAVMEVED